MMMSEPKYVYAEDDSYDWSLFELRDEPKPGYYHIADIQCDDVTIEKIASALNGGSNPDAYLGMTAQEARSE